MAIGSFLASAGRIGEGIERYQTESELRRLQREALARAETERKQLSEARLGGAAIPDMAGLLMPAEGTPSAILPTITPSPQLAAPAAAAPPAAGLTPPAATPAATPAAAAATTAKPFVRKVGEVVVPMFDSRKPDRLHEGVAGFRKPDPNASDFVRGGIEKRNTGRLEGALRTMRDKTNRGPLTEVYKYFSPQDKKKALETGQKASAWYDSKQANTYFRANPEMVAVAEKNPLEFYTALMGYNKAPPEGGRWLGKEATAPAAGVATPTAAGAPAATSKILANGFPQSYKDPVYDFADQKAAEKVGVPVELIRAVRLAGEKTDADRVSSAGARTPYQFTPKTRKLFINKYKVDPWSTPINAATAAAYHLKESLDKGLSFEDALREYHGGPNRKEWGKFNDAYAERTMAFLGGAPAGGGARTAGVSTAVTAQEPVLNITSLNSYLADPAKVPITVANTSRQRDLLKREALIYAQSGNEAGYQQALARIQETDANLTRLVGAQAIIDINNFNDPRRAERLLSYLSNGDLRVQMRQNGNFAYFARNQQGQYVPIPGQDNVSRAGFISTLRAASDEVYRTQRDQVEAAAAAAEAKFQQDVGLEVVKGRIQGELQTPRLQVEINKALLDAKVRLQVAEQQGKPIALLGNDEAGVPMYVLKNPENADDPLIFKSGGFRTAGPGGEEIITTDAIPLSQLAGTQR